jgi:hypothetical protein
MEHILHRARYTNQATRVLYISAIDSSILISVTVANNFKGLGSLQVLTRFQTLLNILNISSHTSTTEHGFELVPSNAHISPNCPPLHPLSLFIICSSRRCLLVPYQRHVDTGKALKGIFCLLMECRVSCRPK